jgi:hypothetical protein
VKNSAKKLLLETQRKDTKSTYETPNPVSLSDVDKMMRVISSSFVDFPEAIRKKIAEPGISIIKMGSHPLRMKPLDFSDVDIG